METAEDEIFWMRAALEEARRAGEAGEVPIGAVVVCRGQIVGRGANRVERARDALAHAEMAAIQQAQAWLGDWRLEECSLYVTKEPCPMCAGAALQTRMARIVYGLADPAFGAVESRWRLWEGGNRQVAISGGVLARESLALLQNFFQEIRRRKKAVASRKEGR